MRSNPFVTALTAITSILALIALIAWFVTLSGGSGAVVAAVIVGLSLPGSFLALLTTLLALALRWEPLPTTVVPVTQQRSTSRHWLDDSPDVPAPAPPSEPDSW